MAINYGEEIESLQSELREQRALIKKQQVVLAGRASQVAIMNSLLKKNSHPGHADCRQKIRALKAQVLTHNMHINFSH